MDAANCAAGTFTLMRNIHAGNTHGRGLSPPRLAAGSALALCLMALRSGLPADPEVGLSGGVSEASPSEPATIDELSRMSLDELLQVEVPVVYAASKHLQKATDAPSSVTVITRDEIQKFGYRTLAETLRAVRSFYITFDRNYWYLGARGFLRPGDYNSRILVLIDGHRQNENIFDSGFVGTEMALDMDLVERIEVVRGPGSSLYGSNAFFAVVNVVTRRPKDFQWVEASGSAGSFSTYTGRGSVGHSFESGVDFLLSASGLTSDGQTFFYREFADPNTNSGFSRNNDAEDLYSLFGTMAYKGLRLDAVYNWRQKEIPTAAYSSVFNDPEETTIDSRGYVDLKYDREFEDLFKVLARVRYDRYFYTGYYPYEGDVGGIPTRIMNRDWALGEWWGAELQLSRRVLDRALMTVGASFDDNFRQDQRNWDREPYQEYLDDRRSLFNWALYAQADVTVIEEQPWAKKLSLNIGVRYDHYESVGGSTNPRTAVIWQPLEATTLKAIYGTAFRAPNLYELYYNDGGRNSKASPDLNPEEITTYELVWEQRLTPRFLFTATAFHYEIDGLMGTVIDPADGLLVFQNLNGISNDGAELELEGKFRNGTRGRLSYSFQENSERLTNSPKHMVKLGVNVPLFEEKIFAGVEALYFSPRITAAGGTADEHLLVNLTLLGRDLWKNVDVSASVYNLADMKYGDPGGSEHLQDEISQDGISFRVKLTWRF